MSQETVFYIDSEEKQHEFSNAQWVSKLAFMVNIIEKFNYLNASLQAGCGVGVGFLRTEVGFFHPTPTPEVQLNHLLYRTPKLGSLTRAYSNGTTSFETFNEI